MNIHDSAETRSALFTALERTPAITNRIYAPAAPTPTAGETQWIATSPDGKTLAIGGKGPVIEFFDAVRYAYVGSLDVKRPDGSTAGKMRFGLWVEPERFDRGFRGSSRVPSAWALPGTAILDFTHQDVVDGITDRIQRVIRDYAVDYLKVDANQDLIFNAAKGRTGHLWTRWSVGFERFLSNLRKANKSLYMEHSASGLKRYWIGLPRLVHSTWLDDDVALGNVGHLLVQQLAVQGQLLLRINGYHLPVPSEALCAVPLNIDLCRHKSHAILAPGGRITYRASLKPSA